MNHATHTGGLPSYAMRAILTSLFGPQYIAPAARYLGVQEKRIRWWTSPEQDTSPHASSFAIREKVEAIFASDLTYEADREPLLLEIEAMNDGVAYISQLLEVLEAQPAR
jgi:hypothetical protein